MAQDILADGFVKLCIDPSLNFYDGKCRVLVEGQMSADGSATADVLRTVASVRDLEVLFGEGSILTESLKKIFCTCPSNIEVQVIPRADPASSVAATYTITITGTATADGRMEFFMLDSAYALDVFIATGQTPTQIAATIAAAIPEDLPYTATSALGVVTLVAKNKGTVGNFLNIVYNWRGLTNYAPASVVVAVARTVAGTGDIVPLNYKSLFGSCCFSCFILQGESSAYQTAWQQYLETLWDCDDPQCFGHGYVWNSGSLGQVLARTSNAGVFNRLAVSPNDLSPPYFKVAAYGALSCCTACSNPELSIQGRQYGVLGCLLQPENCAPVFTFDEQEQLREAGFVVSGPFNGGSGAYTSPYIFNDITNYLYDAEGRPNATFRDTNARRLTAATSLSIAAMLQQFSALAFFTKNTAIKQGIFGTNKRLLLASIRAWAKNNIGILFSEFDDIDNDIVLQTDFEVAPTCQGNPNLLHLFFRYRPPVRINRIATTLQPKILDNCQR